MVHLSPPAQSVVLLVVGASMVQVALGSELTTYVRPSSRWMVAAAGCAIVLASVWSLSATRSDRVARPVVWALLAPVVVLTIVRPPPLGLLSADRPPATPPRHDGGFARLPEHGIVALKLSDVVLRTVWDHGTSLRGRTLRFVGFVVHANRGGFVVARFVITCCAADARPYDVGVRTGLVVPSPGTWVAVTGRYLGADPTNEVVPLVRADDLERVTRPADPYE